MSVALLFKPFLELWYSIEILGLLRFRSLHDGSNEYSKETGNFQKRGPKEVNEVDEKTFDVGSVIILLFFYFFLFFDVSFTSSAHIE